MGARKRFFAFLYNGAHKLLLIYPTPWEQIEWIEWTHSLETIIRYILEVKDSHHFDNIELYCSSS